MNKIQNFGSTNLTKGRIVNFGAGLQYIRLNICFPKILDLLFRGEQRNSGMDLPPPVLKVREYHLGISEYMTISF